MSSGQTATIQVLLNGLRNIRFWVYISKVIKYVG
jgi:hypothetical protein